MARILKGPGCLSSEIGKSVHSEMLRIQPHLLTCFGLFSSCLLFLSAYFSWYTRAFCILPRHCLKTTACLRGNVPNCTGVSRLSAMGGDGAYPYSASKGHVCAEVWRVVLMRTPRRVNRLPTYVHPHVPGNAKSVWLVRSVCPSACG